jgi:cytochrome P450
VLEEVREHHGAVVGLGAWPARLAIVGDPAAIADLFAEPTDSYRWNHRFNVLALSVGKESIIVSDGADHHRRRSAIQAGFSRRRLNGWIPMILDTIDATIDRLVTSLDEPAQVVDMCPVGRSLVLEIVVRALCGPRLVDRVPEISDLLERTQDYLEASALAQVPHPFPVGQRHRARQERRAFDAIVDDEIARLRTTPDGDELNVLETLVATGELTDSEIRDQIVTLLGAGFDTTSATLAWLLLRAAEAPGLWDRLADEADVVFGKVGEGHEPDHTTLAALDLADRTVRESLRLHPPGAFGVRETVTDVVAGGFLIPRHTLVAWSPHLAGRDPHCWPDPLRFDPDRHLDLTPEQAAQARAAWVPFGGGARSCLGFALAQIELTLILARLAQRLELAPAGAAIPWAAEGRRAGDEHEGSHAPTRRSHPRGGARLHLTPR